MILSVENSFIFLILGVMSFVFITSVVCCVLIVRDIKKDKPKHKNISSADRVRCGNCGYPADSGFLICPRCGELLERKGED